MTDPLWRTDPLRCMIDPIDRTTFFRDYHEKKALIVSRDDPGRYRDLLSIARIDDIISNQDLRPGQRDMARSEPPVSAEMYTFETGHIDRGGVAEQYRQGATIILPQLHYNDARLGDFCRAMESELSCQVQTNIYLTPPHNQGFKTHYDDHDVFVLQIEGEKLWRLYDTPIENPYRGEGFQAGAHPIGEPVEEFVLRAGECAYVPRGLMHDASTHGDAPSLHITLGLIVKTWADLMLEAVSEVALRHPGFRRALPVGFAQPDFDRSAAEAHFKSLLGLITQEADLEAAMDLFVDTFIRSRLPNTAGTITSVSNVDRISPPITVMPIGARQAESPDSDSAVGTMPATIATVVITIGWARLWPASTIASFLGTPFSISSSAKSMTRIEFLATMPSSINRPMNTGSESGWPARWSASAPPSGASSSEPRLTNGGMIRL